MDEQRDRLRLALKKLAFAKNDKGARGGLLRDISSSGAGLEFVNPMGTVDQPFLIGDEVEIIVDGFKPLAGKIVRTDEKGIFVHFVLNTADEEMLLAEIMAATNDIAFEE